MRRVQSKDPTLIKIQDNVEAELIRLAERSALGTPTEIRSGRVQSDWGEMVLSQSGATVLLPKGETGRVGQVVAVGVVSEPGGVTVQAQSGDDIDGASSRLLANRGDWLIAVLARPSLWVIIGGTASSSVEQTVSARITTGDVSIAAGSDVLISGLTLSIATRQGDTVTVGWTIPTNCGSLNSRSLLTRVDGGAWTSRGWYTLLGGQLFAGSIPVSLSPGDHTIEFGLRCDVATSYVMGGGTGIFGGAHYPISETWATVLRPRV